MPALIIFSTNVNRHFLFQLRQSFNTCMNDWKIRQQGKIFWQKTTTQQHKNYFRWFTLLFVGSFHLKCLYQRKRDLELCALLYSLHQPLLATGTEHTENTKQSFRRLRHGNNNSQHGRKLNDCKTTPGVKICLRLNKKQRTETNKGEYRPQPLNNPKEERHVPTQTCSQRKRSSSEG